MGKVSLCYTPTKLRDRLHLQRAESIAKKKKVRTFEERLLAFVKTARLEEARQLLSRPPEGSVEGGLGGSSFRSAGEGDSSPFVAIRAEEDRLSPVWPRPAPVLSPLEREDDAGGTTVVQRSKTAPADVKRHSSTGGGRRPGPRGPGGPGRALQNPARAKKTFEGILKVLEASEEGQQNLRELVARAISVVEQNRAELVHVRTALLGPPELAGDIAAHSLSAAISERRMRSDGGGSKAISWKFEGQHAPDEKLKQEDAGVSKVMQEDILARVAGAGATIEKLVFIDEDDSNDYFVDESVEDQPDRANEEPVTVPSYTMALAQQTGGSVQDDKKHDKEQQDSPFERNLMHRKSRPPNTTSRPTTRLVVNNSTWSLHRRPDLARYSTSGP